MNESQQPRKRAAKLFHKKSRTGCQQCRSRRVKCDEAKPICSHCNRLSLTCIYDRAQSDTNSASPTESGGQQNKAAETIVDPPESESRRRLELRLFHHYMAETGPSLSLDPATAHFWNSTICRLALESDSTLYAIYMVSALHMQKRSTMTDTKYLDICQTYLNMSIREHHRDVAEINLKNVEYIVLTSGLLRVHGFTRLQGRSLEPYTPPIDFLRITNTSTALFQKAGDLTQYNPESVASEMIESAADLLADLRNSELPSDLSPLVNYETGDKKTEEAYARAITYIGCIRKALDEKDVVKSIGRRTIVFPMVMHKEFADLVEELRPRALVILAYYFGYLSMLSEFWWVGDSGFREIRAIERIMPKEWLGWLEWPRSVVRDQDVKME
ncbi:uncharacterized protein B0J16DRAFT_381601 [Fusarium flagelliforme]|uniref:uncharacterized protein n=1 Tax=Fusarium flagelliforme TaxID=2675880 RepID=UPI001E8DD259|nr:uncharacterized protein B0J16DRAFT_381601 [Fusarium flagelliforme]KAH7193727.1 hypothetical protein B0J16DRAFT_381601 [Fusarium flagelliforme]